MIRKMFDPTGDDITDLSEQLLGIDTAEGILSDRADEQDGEYVGDLEDFKDTDDDSEDFSKYFDDEKYNDDYDINNYR
ncbi:MAG: hypothetical protein Q8865_04860 [Bacillota bacterium]|nr:hypothetical protein [Bacillota bacterium]